MKISFLFSVLQLSWFFIFHRTGKASLFQHPSPTVQNVSSKITRIVIKSNASFNSSYLKNSSNNEQSSFLSRPHDNARDTRFIPDNSGIIPDNPGNPGIIPDNPISNSSIILLADPPNDENRPSKTLSITDKDSKNTPSNSKRTNAKIKKHKSKKNEKRINHKKKKTKKDLNRKNHKSRKSKMKRKTQKHHSKRAKKKGNKSIDRPRKGKNVNVSRSLQEKDESWAKFRLPTSVVPIHYVIRLQADLDYDFKVSGTVEIEIDVKRSTQFIKLHSQRLDIDKSSIKVKLSKNHRIIPVSNVKFNPKRRFLIIKLNNKLRPGRTYNMALAFSYRLNDEPIGFYRMEYRNYQGNYTWIAATQFWPAEASRSFPCFDEPALKATFDVHLSRALSMQTLSNMPLVRSYQIDNSSDIMWDHFATTVKMSTYHLAFAITDFTATEKITNSTSIKVWSQYGTESKSNLSLHVAYESIVELGHYFDIQYPLPKLDLIALPNLAYNAMENWGLITFKETTFLADEKSSAEHSLSVAVLVAHEIAHQWFGNLVTINWWSDLWLTEGFATYMSFDIIQKVSPTLRSMDQFVVTRQQRVMALDSLLSTHPVNTPVRDPSKINDVFDRIPYDKGASIIRMMSHFLTKNTFQKGIKYYLKQYQYGNSDQDGLWQMLMRASREDNVLPAGVTVKDIMDSWTLQEGYPVVTVSKNGTGTATLTQKPFTLGFDPVNSNRMWWIPISFTSALRPTFIHTRAQTWLRKVDSSVTVTGVGSFDKWIIFNIQQTGYYRVNYDVANWNLLADQLMRDHRAIHVLNRAQLIDDSMNLARAGEMPYNVTLYLLSYLKHERDLVPWQAAVRNLKYLNSMLSSSPHFGYFKLYIKTLISPLGAVMGAVMGRESLHVESKEWELLKSELLPWFCQINHEYCTRKIKDILDQIKKKKALESFEETVLCSAIERSGDDVWENVFILMKRTEDPNTKDMILRALGCTRYSWLLNRYLNLIEDPDSGLQIQDAAKLYRSAARTTHGTCVAWTNFRHTWQKLKRYSDYLYNVAPKLLTSITESFNNHHQLKELQHFRKKLKKETSKRKQDSAVYSNAPILPSLNKAIAQTETSIRWMEINNRVIVNWFRSQT